MSCFCAGLQRTVSLYISNFFLMMKVAKLQELLQELIKNG